MSTAPVPQIKPDTVADIEPLHRPAQIGLGRLNQQMIVIGHEHIRMEHHPKSFDLLGKQFTEMIAITVGAKDRLPFIPTGGDMIPTVRALDSRSTGHEHLVTGKSIHCQHFLQPYFSRPPADTPRASLKKENM